MSHPAPDSQCRSLVVRLQFILRRLRQNKNGITAAKLAGEWECDARTIYRDVETLRQLGVGIISQSEGHPIIGYSIRAHACPFCDGRKMREELKERQIRAALRECCEGMAKQNAEAKARAAFGKN